MAYLNTKAAASALGLSAYELRRGFKSGIYPGIQVGEKGKRLKFDPVLVQEAIQRRIGEREDCECNNQS